ncbi:hypothetical protein [Nocardioides sp. CFH 31398]|uniref:hypothetical protein n=1 Tax=Nocardioides sp. CFH 31398 TaxID=2919579 RepID=UPI001F060AA6|nr:hypothetical protein [Nocardioides sp. CFH 31398]MCH1865760.1 hypothetical protein [Nocardioides sp. CFH 31398]
MTPFRPGLPPRLRTLGALALLGAALPANAAVTAGAAVVGAALGAPAPPEPAGGRRTVMLSGGKMTKALQLARSFHAAGHRVVLVEAGRYRFSGHRFSRAVDAFHVVPPSGDPAYADALVEVVAREGVDVYVPVCSPASSRHDALAKPRLEALGVEVVHLDPDDLEELDDKASFAALATALDLPVPLTHRVTDPAEVADFDFAAHPGVRWVLKSIAYDPVNRLDLTPLPLATPEETAAFAASKPISADNPWLLQELVDGVEYCTHGTARDGRLRVWACCASSAFQVNYTMVDHPEIEAWVTRLVEERKLTGQVSFDFLERADGTIAAIECNPRTHSAITMFHRHPGLAAAYLTDEPIGSTPGGDRVVPLPDYTPTYWAYHELWRLLSDPTSLPERWATVRHGRDAILDVHDPLPFLLVHHLQVPSLLLRALVTGRDWIRIDFNIGKLVEIGGD